MSFTSLAEKIQPVPIKKNLLQWCPTMDLIAMISDSDEVSLNRLSGQRVWSVTPALAGTPEQAPVSLAWRPDGKVLAVGLANGTCHCLDINDGRVIDRLRISSDSYADNGPILNWVEGSLENKPTRTKHLRLDVRSQLPSLAPIPSSSTERMFADVESITTLIHDLEKSTNTIRLIVAGTGQSEISIALGAMRLQVMHKSVSEAAASDNVFSHCSSMALDTHALIVQGADTCSLQLYELGIFKQNEPVIKDMISHFNDFHAVFAFLGESLSYMQEEYRTFLETKDPALDKLDGIMGDKPASRDSLFNFLMTGVADEKLGQWLEGVGERLIKRWEKACQVNLHNIAKVIDESCLRACDRLIITIVKLKAISRETSCQNVTRLQGTSIDATMKALELLIAQLHVLKHAIHVENRLFTIFCEWLCFTITRPGEDSETSEAIMPVETSDVAIYLDKHYVQNAVDGLFTTNASDIVDMATFLALDKSSDTLEPFPQLSGSGTPSLFQTMDTIQSFATKMFAAPEQALTSQWRPRASLLLTQHEDTTAFARFVQSAGEEALYTVLIEHDDQASALYLVRSLNVASAHFEICKIVPVLEDVTDCIVQDAKFADDSEIIVLLQSSGEDKTSHLIAFEYTSLDFSEHVDGAVPITSSAGAGQRIVPAKHRALDAGIHPISLAVNGRNGRRTGLYLQADRQRYTVFDLDDQEDDEDAEHDSDAAADEMQEE